MCDPVTLGLAVAASAGGAAITGQSNASNAEAQANAANQVLAANIAKQNGYEATNQATLNSNLNKYAPDAQAKQLSDAQTKRSGADVGAISASDPTYAPITQDAPDAVRGEIAKRMASTNDYAKGVANAQGQLGGYTDNWQQNSLNNADASRQIGYTNNLSDEERSLLGPEQQLAEHAAYQPPSPWGAILSGTGSILGSAAGSSNGGSSMFSSLFGPNTSQVLPGGAPLGQGGIGHA